MTSALLRRLAAAVAGLVATSGFAVVASAAEAASAPLISTDEATWSYLDDGSDPAAELPDRTDWTDPEFDDAGWKTAKGSFGAKNGALGSVSGFMPNTLLTQYSSGTTDIPAYFFRTEVNVPAGTLDDATSLSASLVYDDAATVYVNGIRVAGFDDETITSNLAYGGSNDDVPKLATFAVPASMFVTGSNTVAVELHQGRASSSDIYLDFTSLQPGADVPPVAAAVSDLILNIGADESQRNVNWMSTSSAPEVVQLVAASALVAGEFPTTGAQTITSTQGAASDSGKTYHKATITGLEPSTEYAYRAGQEGSWSAVARFLTGDFDNNYDFIYVGDPQIGSSGNPTSDANGFADTLDKAKIEVPASEFIFSAGDQVDSGGNEGQYDGFFSPHQVRELATATTMGNHDNGNRALYAQHYNLPNMDPATGDYWYTYGDTLYLNLDSNFNNEAQRAAHVAWMEDVLAANPDTTWQVALMHHAMYSSGPHSTDGDVLERRAFFSGEFQRLGVDLALAGHDHTYARSHPMDGTTPVPAAAGTDPTVVQAGEGNVLYVTASSASGSKFYSASNGNAPYLAASSGLQVPQFSKVAVRDDRIVLTTYRTDTMAVIDEVTLQGGEPSLPADWLVPDAKQRLPFTVEGAGLSGSLEGFPALVKFDNDDLDFAAADPDHLVFTAGSDPTPLAYQVEKWDPTGSSVWVKLPNVSASASEIELYFDGAPQNATTATDVWDNDYITVNHFNAASGNFPDATANGWTGTVSGTNASYGAESGSGTPAYQITGTGTVIDFGTEMAASSNEAVTFSTSVWIDPSQCTAADTGYRVLAGRDIGGGKMPGETYSLVCYQGKVFPRFVVGDGDTSAGVNASGGNAFAATDWPAGAWHELATTFDGSTIRTYLDGDEMATFAVSGTIGDGLVPPHFIVDGYDNATGGVKMAIDEMRISTVARSADWMKAEHLAQTGDLVKVGAIEAPTQLQLSVTKPEEGARVVGTTLQLTGTTSGAEVTYRVDDAAPVSLGTVNGDYAATIEGLALGSHTIEIVATDGDSQKTVTRSFTVVEPGTEGEPRLSVSDDDVVSGLVDLGVTRPDGPPSADGVSITVDGTSLPVTVRNDQASAVFEVGGWQTGFKQDVTLNGQSLNPPHADFSGTMRLDIPLDGIHEGANTLRVATGSGIETADTARNNDDFDITDPRIELLGTGLTLRDSSVDPAAKLLIGDGFPAGTANPPVYYRDFIIEVAPGQLTALVASWDTALAADGEHTVTATTPGGSVTANVVSDNTAPRVTFHEPADGGRYTGSFDIDVTATDPHEVDTLSLMLDGQEVKQADVIDVDAIGAGEHTLTAHVIDSLGNAQDVSATFDTIGNAPDQPSDPHPADGATDVDPAQVELSVTASDPAGDALDVTFKRAFQGAATSVKEGTTKAATPGADDGTSVSAAGKVSEVDGESVTTSADQAYPFQQFEVAVPSGLTSDKFTIAWTGAVPAGHRAALSVWDHTASAWKSLTDGPGGEPLALTATASIADTVRNGVAQVLVQDQPKVVLDDDDVATISWLTDTQNYSERESSTYDKQIQWTLDHWKTDDISYGVHTGDIVNVASQRVQWENASKSHEPWDEAEFPYGVVPGNHDIASGQYETYREFFGEARFKDNPWYGGTNQDNVQHYDLFSTPDADYLFLYVDWSLSQDEIDWANEIIESHPTYNVILATHQYLLNGGAYVTPGQEIFDKIVLPNPSVKMILSGHTPGVAMNVKRPSQDRVVVEVMQDSQAVGFAGDGWMRTFDMDATNQTTTHRTFSVTKEGNNFAGNGTTFVAPSDWSGTTNAENFTVPMDIELASREISTDALVATTLSDDLLGQPVHVESGARAAVTVRNLAPATTHQWYAEAKDVGGHSTVSDVFTFMTADAATPGTPETPLAISSIPRITGSPVVGSTLTATPATFTGDPTRVTGQWLADGVPIDGESATKLVVTVEQIGARISYRSVAEKTGADSMTATSASLAPVAKLSVQPSITVRPAPYGSATEIVVAIPAPAGLPSVPGTVTVRGVGPAQTRAASAVALTFQLPATLKPGRYSAMVTYSGSDKVDPVTRVVQVRIGKRDLAAPAVKVTKKPGPRMHGKATIRVATLAGLTEATGRVTITLRKGSVTKDVTVALVRGRATVRLPKLPKGKWRMSVSYGGNPYYLSSNGDGPTVTVTGR